LTGLATPHPRAQGELSGVSQAKNPQDGFYRKEQTMKRKKVAIVVALS